MDWKSNIVFQTGNTGLIHWEGLGGVSLWVSMLLCVRVSVCYMKSVSQREKINEISVTGTSPSTFAHMHTLIPTTDTFLCVTYIHNMCTFLHTAQAHAALCTQSRILMCSLRALLSACVTFNPSTHHFQAHHQTKWKQFSTNAPPPLIQLLHRLRQYSISSILWWGITPMRSVIWVHFSISIINQCLALTVWTHALVHAEGGGKNRGEGELVHVCPTSHNQPEVDYHGVNEN